ncbi:transcription elongation factor GreA [Patescibacteria group bacterium]|nr:transcription elongation factor GreA [Patescibacteria group bacterium]
MSDQKLLTQEGSDRLKAELETLKAKRSGITEKISLARDLGDLSENAEYHEARDQQGFNEGRILEIETLLRDAKVVEKVSSSLVGIGSRIKVKSIDREMEYTIVGATEADPTQGKISCESPLGVSFLGKKLNEEVEVEIPNGRIKYTIISIA